MEYDLIQGLHKHTWNMYIEKWCQAMENASNKAYMHRCVNMRILQAISANGMQHQPSTAHTNNIICKSARQL